MDKSQLHILLSMEFIASCKVCVFFCPFLENRPFGLVASPPYRLAIAPLTSLHRHPRYNLSFRIMVIYHVTYLGSPIRKRYDCKYAELCISITVSVSNCPHFLDSPWIRKWGQFPWFAPIRHRVMASPPCCSLDTQSAFQDMHLEKSREMLPKLCLRQEQRVWKLTSYTVPWVGLGPVLTYQIVGASCRCMRYLYYSLL